MIYIAAYIRLVYYPYQASTQTKIEKEKLNLNTKHKGKQKSYLKETVGVGVSNLKTETLLGVLDNLQSCIKLK